MKKTLTVLLALVLVIAMSVAGTMAYLTSTTGPVTNTFTVGKVAITLDETDVDVYGKKDGDTRVTENSYRLIPGKNYTKDPVVHFQPDSEASWLFVKVENGIKTYEADTKTIASQITANGWTELTGVNNVYYKQVPANFTTAAVDYKVFEEFTIADNAVATGTPTVTVTAYAIQAEGFTTPADAWAKVPTT